MTLDQALAVTSTVFSIIALFLSIKNYLFAVKMLEHFTKIIEESEP